ncbi:NTP transferase domain-containing protein [Helicobacter saguini]|uniref:Bifunctional protein GlmU n=1 Tax=Helicobacter saguini TaxID=1548018 RepID=A0A4U8T0R4_9HELI|nr:NTP transferase domain-containing protein [Helicobacter saguini]TLD92989.1 bifunctional UDP-N-acetylglucosamine diphosphorylase/glucosamine-1-phosphate N-acetyltransferase GlmU [Helicobacter saguini]
MLSIVILAAGFGTRMKSNTPKVLHKICGKAMIEYVIDTSLELSSDIHIVLFNQKERVMEHIKSVYSQKCLDSKSQDGFKNIESGLQDSKILRKSNEKNSKKDSKKLGNLESNLDSKSQENSKKVLDSITFHTQLHEKYPGTGGALMQDSKQLLNLKGEKILILSGDTPLVCTGDLKPLIDNNADINIATFITQNPSGYGRIVRENREFIESKMQDSKHNIESKNQDFNKNKRVDSNDFIESKDLSPTHRPIDEKIIGIIEEKDCNDEEKKINEVNGGIYCFKKHILESNLPKLENNNKQGEFYLTDIITLALKSSSLDSKNRTQSCKKSSKNPNFLTIKTHILNENTLQGVNTKAHLAKAQDIMLNRLRQKAMENGVIMDIPATIYLDSMVEFRGECVLQNGVRICGQSVIENSEIRANAVVISSVIESSVIKENSSVENSKIKKSDVGPNAHIRPNCTIKNTHIGNFVECKNAILDGVKAGHLSYLGDCEIGAGSNVGAGTITCNYDGVKKHKTIIGRDVFIGSDTQLIAPVNVGDSVLIAAGSTITRDIESGSLAISRVEQKNIKNGFFRFFKK